jgi:hypothetical protein
MSELPDDLNRYWGSLTPPADTPPADLVKIKARFLRIVKIWASKHKYIVEFRGQVHPTSPTAVHFDLVAYTDAPHKPVHKVVQEAWKRAGGLRSAFTRFGNAETDAIALYQAKAIDKPAKKLNVDLLLRPRSEIGLEITWQTGGFWMNNSIEHIWQTLIEEWRESAQEITITPIAKTEAEDPKSGSALIVDNKHTTINDRLYDPKTDSKSLQERTQE